jgi:hypothetical protein
MCFVKLRGNQEKCGSNIFLNKKDDENEVFFCNVNAEKGSSMLLNFLFA